MAAISGAENADSKGGRALPDIKPAAIAASREGAQAFRGFKVADRTQAGEPEVFGETVYEDESKRILPGKTYEAAMSTCVAAVIFDEKGEPAGMAHFYSDSHGDRFDPKTMKEVDGLIGPQASVLIVHGTNEVESTQRPFIATLKSWLTGTKKVPEERIRVHESSRYDGLIEKGDESAVVLLASKEEGVRLDYLKGGGLVARTVAVERISPILG
jgi:hypothetical protein